MMMREMEVKDISLHAQSLLMNKYSFSRQFLARKDNANYVFVLLLKIRRLEVFYSNCFIKLSFNIFTKGNCFMLSPRYIITFTTAFYNPIKLPRFPQKC